MRSGGNDPNDIEDARYKLANAILSVALDQRRMDHDRAGEGNGNVMCFRIGSDGIAMMQGSPVVRSQQIAEGTLLPRGHPVPCTGEADVYLVVQRLFPFAIRASSASTSSSRITCVGAPS